MKRRKLFHFPDPISLAFRMIEQALILCAHRREQLILIFNVVLFHPIYTFSRSILSINTKAVYVSILCTYSNAHLLSTKKVTNGGVVMVSFFSYFVSCNKTTTIQDVIGESIYSWE